MWIFLHTNIFWFQLWRIALCAQNTDVSMKAIQILNSAYFGQGDEFLITCMQSLQTATRDLPTGKDETLNDCEFFPKPIEVSELLWGYLIINLPKYFDAIVHSKHRRWDAKWIYKVCKGFPCLRNVFSNNSKILTYFEIPSNLPFLWNIFNSSNVSS